MALHGDRQNRAQRRPESTARLTHLPPSLPRQVAAALPGQTSAAAHRARSASVKSASRVRWPLPSFSRVPTGSLRVRRKGHRLPRHGAGTTKAASLQRPRPVSPLSPGSAGGGIEDAWAEAGKARLLKVPVPRLRIPVASSVGGQDVVATAAAAACGAQAPWEPPSPLGAPLDPSGIGAGWPPVCQRSLSMRSACAPQSLNAIHVSSSVLAGPGAVLEALCGGEPLPLSALQLGASTGAADIQDWDGACRTFPQLKVLSLQGTIHSAEQDAALRVACRRGLTTGLRALACSGCLALRSETVAAALRASPSRLMRLQLRGCTGLGDIPLGEALRFAPFLREVCVADNPQLGDHTATAIGALTSLTAIDVAGSPWLDDRRAAKMLESTSARLLELTASRCEALSDAGVAAVLGRKQPWGHTRSTTDCVLERLILDACPRVRGTFLELLTRMAPNLAQVDLSGTAADYATGIANLWVCSRLAAISLSGCRRLSDNAVLALAGLDPGAASPAKLAALSLEAATGGGAAALRLLRAEAPDSAHPPPCLELLDLTGCSLTSAGVVAATLLIPTLTALGLSFTSLNDGGLAGLLPGCGPRLRHLSIHGCEAVTGAGLASLARACPQLASLDISGCTLLGDDAASVRRAIRCLSQLEVVVATGCCGAGSSILQAVPPSLRVASVAGTDATSEAVTKLLRVARMLEHLDIAGCPEVADSSIRPLSSPSSHAGRRLHTLNVLGCTGIRRKTVEQAARLRQWAGIRAFLPSDARWAAVGPPDPARVRSASKTLLAPRATVARVMHHPRSSSLGGFSPACGVSGPGVPPALATRAGKPPRTACPPPLLLAGRVWEWSLQHLVPPVGFDSQEELSEMALSRAGCDGSGSGTQRKLSDRACDEWGISLHAPPQTADQMLMALGTPVPSRTAASHAIQAGGGRRRPARALVEVGLPTSLWGFTWTDEARTESWELAVRLERVCSRRAAKSIQCAFRRHLALLRQRRQARNEAEAVIANWLPGCPGLRVIRIRLADAKAAADSLGAEQHKARILRIAARRADNEKARRHLEASMRRKALCAWASVVRIISARRRALQTVFLAAVPWHVRNAKQSQGGTLRSQQCAAADQCYYASLRNRLFGRWKQSLAQSRRATTDARLHFKASCIRNGTARKALGGLAAAARHQRTCRDVESRYLPLAKQRRAWAHWAAARRRSKQRREAEEASARRIARRWLRALQSQVQRSGQIETAAVGLWRGRQLKDRATAFRKLRERRAETAAALAANMRADNFSDCRLRRAALHAWKARLLAKRQGALLLAKQWLSWRVRRAWQAWISAGQQLGAAWNLEWDSFLKRDHAACKIQSVWRGRCAMAEFRRQQAARDVVATSLQQAWRRQLSKREAAKVAQTRALRAFWAGERNRISMEAEDAESARIEQCRRAAVRISEAWANRKRRIQGSERIKAMRLLAAMQAATESADLARQTLALHQLEQARKAAMPVAATLIQAAWRGFAERRVRQSLAKLRRRFVLARRLQRLARSRLARDRAQAAMRARAENAKRLRERRAISACLRRACCARTRGQQARVQLALLWAIGLELVDVVVRWQQLAAEVAQDAMLALEQAAWTVGSVVGSAGQSPDWESRQRRLSFRTKWMTTPHFPPGHGVRVVKPRSALRGETATVVHARALDFHDGRVAVRSTVSGAVRVLPRAFPPDDALFGHEHWTVPLEPDPFRGFHCLAEPKPVPCRPAYAVACGRSFWDLPLVPESLPETALTAVRAAQRDFRFARASAEQSLDFQVCLADRLQASAPKPLELHPLPDSEQGAAVGASVRITDAQALWLPVAATDPWEQSALELAIRGNERIPPPTLACLQRSLDSWFVRETQIFAAMKVQRCARAWLARRELMRRRSGRYTGAGHILDEATGLPAGVKPSEVFSAGLEGQRQGMLVSLDRQATESDRAAEVAAGLSPPKLVTWLRSMGCRRLSQGLLKAWAAKRFEERMVGELAWLSKLRQVWAARVVRQARAAASGQASIRERMALGQELPLVETARVSTAAPRQRLEAILLADGSPTAAVGDSLAGASEHVSDDALPMGPAQTQAPTGLGLRQLFGPVPELLLEHPLIAAGLEPLTNPNEDFFVGGRVERDQNGPTQSSADFGQSKQPFASQKPLGLRVRPWERTVKTVQPGHIESVSRAGGAQEQFGRTLARHFLQVEGEAGVRASFGERQGKAFLRSASLAKPVRASALDTSTSPGGPSPVEPSPDAGPEAAGLDPQSHRKRGGFPVRPSQRARPQHAERCADFPSGIGAILGTGRLVMPLSGATEAQRAQVPLLVLALWRRRHCLRVCTWRIADCIIGPLCARLGWGDIYDSNSFLKNELRPNGVASSRRGRHGRYRAPGELVSDEQTGKTSCTARCFAGPWVTRSAVERRVWVGPYKFDHVDQPCHTSTGGWAMYHGEWLDSGCAAGAPHGLGFATFLQGHPMFDPKVSPEGPTSFERLVRMQRVLLGGTNDGACALAPQGEAARARTERDVIVTELLRGQTERLWLEGARDRIRAAKEAEDTARSLHRIGAARSIATDSFQSAAGGESADRPLPSWLARREADRREELQSLIGAARQHVLMAAAASRLATEAAIAGLPATFASAAEQEQVPCAFALALRMQASSRGSKARSSVSKQNRILHLQSSFDNGRPVGQCWIRFEDGAQYSGPFLGEAPTRCLRSSDLPGVRTMSEFSSASRSAQARAIGRFKPYTSRLGERSDSGRPETAPADSARCGTADAPRDLLHWGVWTKPCGSVIQGPCVDNYLDPAEVSGYALETLPSGEMYQGYFWHGKKHGWGIRILPTGEQHAGTWDMGVANGPGEVIFSDGSQLRAGFKAGVHSGFAIRHAAGANQDFVGLTAHSLPDGFGIQRSCREPAADREQEPGEAARARQAPGYMGQWKAGQKHGLGAEVLADGSVFAGCFRQGLRHGRGVLRWLDGRTLSGSFSGGKEHGSAVLTSPIARAAAVHAEDNGEQACLWPTGETAQSRRRATSCPNRELLRPSREADSRVAAELQAAFGAGLWETGPRSPSSRRTRNRSRSQGRLAVEPPAARIRPAAFLCDLDLEVFNSVLDKATRAMLCGDIASAESLVASQVVNALAGRPATSAAAHSSKASSELRTHVHFNHGSRVGRPRELVSVRATEAFLRRYPLRSSALKVHSAGASFWAELRDLLHDADLTRGGLEALLGVQSGGLDELKIVPAPEAEAGAQEAPRAKATASAGTEPGEHEGGGGGSSSPRLAPLAGGSFSGFDAAIVAAALPILPPGVDGLNEEVRRVCRALVAANGAVAGTVGLRRTREMLQAALLKQTRLTIASRAKLRALSDARDAEHVCKVSMERAKMAERDSRLRASSAAKELESFWRSPSGRSRGEYLAAVADLGAVHELDWADVRAQSPPFTGDRRMLGAVRRGLSLICSIPDDWDAVVLMLSSRSTCETAGTLGTAGSSLPLDFSVRLVAELHADTISPLQLAEDTELLGALDDLLKGYPDLVPDDKRIVAISPALSALVRFIRAMTTHARKAAPALPFYRKAKAAQAMMCVSQERFSSAERGLSERGRDVAFAAKQLDLAVQSETQMRHELAWLARQCREAREIVKVWHGVEGLLGLEAALPAVPPEVLEPVVGRGRAGQLEDFLPALRSHQLEAVTHHARRRAARAAASLKAQAWHTFFDESRSREFEYNVISGEWKWGASRRPKEDELDHTAAATMPPNAAEWLPPAEADLVGPGRPHIANAMD